MNRLRFACAALAAILIGCLSVTASSSARAASHPTVVMQTTKGTITFELYPEDAPLSVANFIKLANKGFYNGLMFHRVTDLAGPGQGHIVQGGDPTSKNKQVGDPSLGMGGPGYTIKGEFPQNGVHNPLVHDAGALAMARSSDPDSAGSQFYIVVTPAHFLDGQYAVFGKVVSGLPVAANIVAGDRMTKVYVEKSPKKKAVNAAKGAKNKAK